jgi:formylglycine-generating enzyme required for sulfatase activity
MLKLCLGIAAVVSLPVLVGGQLRTAPAMEFTRIAAGEFMMGCSTGDAQCGEDEQPRHRVQITKPFEIGKYEVTQAQWMALMQANPSASKGDTKPVEMVSKLEVQEFISKLNAQNDGYVYRLPTEAEWEYAARAGADAPYSGSLDEVAWYSGNSDDETHPVGQKKPNGWGLYDVQGNVREWVSDLYDSNYYSFGPAVDPTGPQFGAGGRGGPAGPGRGGPGPRGGRGRGGGPPDNFGPPPPLPPPVALPPGASPQQQIDALRQEVQQLRQEIQQLRNAFEAGGPQPGGPGGRGRGGPPIVVGPDGQLIDALDGLPTGLPVIRGGGWDQNAAFQRVSARYSYYGPTLRVGDIGFRLVRESAAQSR